MNVRLYICRLIDSICYKNCSRSLTLNCKPIFLRADPVGCRKLTLDDYTLLLDYLPENIHDFMSRRPLRDIPSLLEGFGYDVTCLLRCASASMYKIDAANTLNTTCKPRER